MLAGTMLITQVDASFKPTANPPYKAFMSMTFRISVSLTFSSFQYFGIWSFQKIVSRVNSSGLIPVISVKSVN